MVRIYNFQLKDTNVELNVDGKGLTLNIFSTEDSEEGTFESALGDALKRKYREYFEKEDKETFKQLFKEAYTKPLRISAQKELPEFEQMFEENFARTFSINYKEVFIKVFIQQFEELFNASFEEILGEKVRNVFDKEADGFFKPKFFQVDRGLYVKKVIDPNYEIYFRGRESFERHYRELGGTSGETNFRQDLMRTYQVKMNELMTGPLRDDLNLEWIAAEETQVTTARPYDRHLRHLRAAGIGLGETIPLQVPVGPQGGKLDEIIVAVIDTGIDFLHTQLKPFLREVEINGVKGVGYDAYNKTVIQDDNPTEIPQKSHGTGVAGVVAQIFSITDLDADTLKILYIRAFPDGSDSTLAEALKFAGEQGAQVINCSWGPLYYRPHNPLLEVAIKGAKQAGAICVFAAGNQGNPVRGYYPANSDDVITVGSVKFNKKYSEFSNYGPGLDITASGEQVLSYAPGDTVKLYRGTSFAAPVVSATIALFIYKNNVQNINALRNRLRESGGKIIGEITEVLKVDYDHPDPKTRKRLNVKDFLL